jgi:thioredoxin-related protein
MEKKKKQDALVVVGIDFGTTYSGYGYSFRDEYNNDHSKIFSNSDWKSGDGLVTTKTPTVILFDENGKFQSFGYEAEEAYTRLLEYGKADGYSYFSRFKMKLFQDEDSKELVHPILKVLLQFTIYNLIKHFQDIKNQLSIGLKYCLLPKEYTPMNRCRRGRDRMVVGFTTTYAIITYHN